MAESPDGKFLFLTGHYTLPSGGSMGKILRLDLTDLNGLIEASRDINKLKELDASLGIENLAQGQLEATRTRLEFGMNTYLSQVKSRAAEFDSLKFNNGKVIAFSGSGNNRVETPFSLEDFRSLRQVEAPKAPSNPGNDLPDVP